MTALRVPMSLDAAYVLAWAKAFALTELVEAPIYRRLVPTGWGRALGASAVTHPFVWFAFPRIGAHLGWSYVTTSLVSEAFAVLGEAAFFWIAARTRPRRAALVSLVANGASVAVGLLVRYALGWI